ncbi:MAG: hypothetical protein QXR30_03995 [Candidatus Woesearchaeota archaeon]
MRNEDKTCLEIYNILLKNYRELNSKTDQFTNIIGIFFHEIMIFTTNYFLLSNSKGSYNVKIDFPYLTSNYVKKPYIVSFQGNSRSNGQDKNIFNYIFNFNYKKLLYILETFHLNLLVKISNLNYNNSLIALPNKQRFDIYNIIKKFKIKILDEKPLLYVDDKRAQLDFLSSTLFEIFNFIGVVGGNLDILIKSFINYVESRITEKQIRIKEDIFLSNTNSILNNRIFSSLFLLNNKKVISLSHGYSSFLKLDEPIVGYGELSYCNYYIDYGSILNTNFTNFQSPLISIKPKIIHINCKKVEKLYRKKVIKHHYLTKFSNILYIPNAFIANQRYGPFRDIEDFYYLKWQKTLLNLGYNIYYKIHPNNLIFYKELSNIKIVTERIEKIIEKFDIIILDFLGSAYDLAIASDKPVIYFNFGLRNFTKEALELIKKRFFWYDIDLNLDYKEQILSAFNNYNDSKAEKFNEYSELYSINYDPEANQAERINQIILELVN